MRARGMWRTPHANSVGRGTPLDWFVPAQLMELAHCLGYGDPMVHGVHVGRGGQPQLMRFHRMAYAGDFKARIWVARCAGNAHGLSWCAKAHPWLIGTIGADWQKP